MIAEAVKLSDGWVVILWHTTAVGRWLPAASETEAQTLAAQALQPN